MNNEKKANQRQAIARSLLRCFASPERLYPTPSRLGHCSAIYAMKRHCPGKAVAFAVAVVFWLEVLRLALHHRFQLLQMLVHPRDHPRRSLLGRPAWDCDQHQKSWCEPLLPSANNVLRVEDSSRL